MPFYPRVTLWQAQGPAWIGARAMYDASRFPMDFGGVSVPAGKVGRLVYEELDIEEERLLLVSEAFRAVMCVG